MKKILSMVLALTMILSCMCVPSFATEVHAVTTADELADAVLAGGSYELTADVTIPADADVLSVAEDVVFELDLNGFTIQRDNADNQSRGSVIESSGKLKLTDGTVRTDINRSYVINIYGGTAELDVNIIAGAEAHGGLSVGGGAEVTINGGSVLIDRDATRVNSAHAIYTYGNSTINIKDGEFTSGGYDGSLVYQVNGTVNVEGGTFATTGGTYGPASCAGEMKIKDGVFSCTFLDWGGEIAVSGGTFTTAAAQNSAKQYMDTDAMCIDPVTGEIKKYIANIDGTGYFSFEAAVNEAESGDTIIIYSNLEQLAQIVNAGNSLAGITVKLGADIDLNNEEWTPIGNATNKFEGYFDGNNKTISNLRVSGNNRYVGLFGYIKGNGMSASATPTVKNLTLDNVSVGGDYYVGGLAGQGYTCKVENITVKGNVSGTRYVGGIIGHVYVYFDNCHFVGDASCTFDAVGGIAGAGDGRIYNSSVIGDITGNNWVGGIIANGQEGTSVVGCYVKGTVTSGQNWYFGVGGIAGVGGHGYASSMIKNNYFDGEVYLCGEKVNAIVLGMVNAADNESIGTIVEGNSWNTEYYSAETPVVVTAEVPSADSSSEEWAASASLEKSSVRNNNLVMLESDLPHVDAASSNDVVIMDFSDLSTEEVTAAVIENNRKAYVDTNKNGICDEDEIVYRDIQEAIKAAAPDGTVEILKDIKVDKWIMFSERLSIGNGNIITLVIDGLTINGNGHTLTIKSIESAGNGNRLFYDAANLNINDLTITYADGVVGGIGLESGTISNVTINGGAQGVLPGEGEIAITDCTFKTGKAAIYNEAERNNLTVTGNTFDVGTENYAIYLRGATNFTDNTVISGKVNVVSGSPVVTDNDFGENRFKVYNGATATIEDNVINVLTFNDDSEVNSTFADNTLSDAAKEMLLSADFKVLTFETNGGEEIAPITERNSGVVIDLSTYNPQKAGYVFLCWCSDSALTQKVTSVTLNESTTVYAKYVKEPSNGSAGASGVVKYKLTFETNGGTSVKKLTAEKNTEVDLSKYVTEKEGYTFEGWYADKELTKSVTTVELTKSTTVYAKWTKIENEENPWFYDVNSTDWFYENVKYVVDNKLMNGVSEEKFAPHDTLTRAMLVTVLYRLDGEPATNRSIPFADVDMSSYYASAVIWAKQNNIVNGVTENKFAPEAEISREQIAAIMHRYAQYKGYDVRVGENANILSYDDAESVSEYAMASMQYMVGSGLIQGKSATTLHPRDNATRAEIAAILQRFIEQNQK